MRLQATAPEALTRAQDYAKGETVGNREFSQRFGPACSPRRTGGTKRVFTSLSGAYVCTQSLAPVPHRKGSTVELIT